MTLIDRDNRDFDSLLILRLFESLYDENMAEALIEKAKNDNLKPGCMGSIIGFLMKHNFKEAIDYGCSFIELPIPDDEVLRRKILHSIRNLLFYLGDEGWEIAKKIFECEPDFGKEIICSLRGIDTFGGVAAYFFSAESKAELYVWLVRNFPCEGDERKPDGGIVSPREEIADWRDMLPKWIIEEGSEESMRAMKYLVHELPEIELMKWKLKEAEELFRRNSWIPPNPENIIELSKNNNKRYVQSEAQLLEIVMESLKNLERELHGETSTCKFLWNELDRNIWRPKCENDFSDYIKNFLERELGPTKGIIVNREVEIRRGQETDLYINAQTPTKEEQFDKLTVIIETKGCWHRDLKKAMKDQLVDRYLKNNTCRHGIYLVGWFDCEKWDNKDDRKSKSPKWTLQQAKDYFGNQAKELSVGDLKVKSFVMDTSL